MEHAKTETMLNSIGHMLMEDKEYPNQPTLLYAQLDRNAATEAVFKDLGNQLLYREFPNRRIFYTLLDLWESQDGPERWTDLEYVLRDGKFEVTYHYPDTLDPEEDELVRRERALRRHFGEKPIVYGPLSDGDAPWDSD